MVTVVDEDKMKMLLVAIPVVVVTARGSSSSSNSSSNSLNLWRHYFGLVQSGRKLRWFDGGCSDRQRARERWQRDASVAASSAITSPRRNVPSSSTGPDRTGSPDPVSSSRPRLGPLPVRQSDCHRARHALCNDISRRVAGRLSIPRYSYICRGHRSAPLIITRHRRASLAGPCLPVSQPTSVRQRSALINPAQWRFDPPAAVSILASQGGLRVIYIQLTWTIN